MRPVREFRDVPTIVWVTLAFAGGIALAERHGAAPMPVSLIVAGAAAVWVACWIVGHHGLRVFGAAVLLGVLGFTHAVSMEDGQPAWIEAADGRFLTAIGTVHAPPDATPTGWRAVVRLRAIEVEGGAGDRASSRRVRQPRARVPAPSSHPDNLMVAGAVRVTGRGDPPPLAVGAEVAVRGRFRAGRPAGNPGERSERDALRRRGLVGVISAAPGETVTILRPGGWSVRGAVASFRARVVVGILRALPQPHSGLLLSLLLGIDTHLAPEIYQQFSRAGLVHLMVVSGAQVAIVAGACAWAARAARLPVMAATAVSGLGVAAFAGMVEWAPSIGRAVIMTAVGLAAVVAGRPRDRAATLAAAALLLLAASPRALFDIGFQLSFAATWGLLYLSPILQRQFSWMGARLAAAAGVTLAAQIAVGPLLAAHFQTLPVAGLLANVLALPLIALLVPAGFALIPLIVLVPFLGASLLVLLRPGLQVVLWLGQWFGTLSWASMPTPPVSGEVALLFILMLLAGAAIGSGAWAPSRGVRLTAAALAVLALGVWYGQASQPPPLLTVTVLDVGQGDAILIQSPAGRAVLIDGGGEVGPTRSGWDIGRMRVVPALRRAGVRRLDVMLLSHPHEDHVGGLPAVLENFPVGLVLDPGVAHPSPSYIRLLRSVEAGRVPYRSARAGMLIDLGAGVSFTIIHPPEPIPALDGDPVHAGAVIARLALGQAAMLLTGDAEAAAERHLLDRGALVVSQVLKVGHHGSRTSTSPTFVAAVRPSIAVISVGADNSFGHPHPATLQTLADAGVTVYRTDRHGAVRLTTAGEAWRVSTARSGSHARIH